MNVYTLLLILLSSESSASMQGTQRAPWAVSGQAALPPVAASLPLPQLCPTPLGRAELAHPLLANGLASAFTHSTGGAPAPSQVAHQSVCSHLLLSSWYNGGSVLSPLKMNLSAWAKLLKEVGVFTFQSFLSGHFCRHTNMLWYLWT